MKPIIFLSILFCALTMPALAELTDADLDKIRLIVKEEVKPLNDEIGTLKTDVARLDGRLTGVEKQIAHATNVTYGLIALIVASVAIPQIIMAWRSGRDTSPVEKNDERRTEIKITHTTETPTR